MRVYLALRRKLGKTNNGDINATLSEMKHSGISSSSTLSTALHRLEALGFIEKTRQGGIAFGGKLCSLYRFTVSPTNRRLTLPRPGFVPARQPTTGDWRLFNNLAQARAVARPFTRKNKVKVRPADRSAATSEAEKAVCGSTVKQVTVSPVRPSKRTQQDENHLKAA